MKIILVLLIGWGFYCIFDNIHQNSNGYKKQVKENNLKMGILGFGRFTYAGGWSELSEIRDLEVNIMEENLHITVVSNYVSEKDKFTKLNIPYKNIKNVSIKIQSEMQNNATLGKILLVGIFAFSKKKKDNSFLIIDYMDEFNSEQSLALMNENGFSNFMQDLNKQRRKHLNNA